MEELIKLLINSDLKTVAKDTGIPYDRMYKWTKGVSNPKIQDYNLLNEYFLNGKSSIEKPQLLNPETDVVRTTGNSVIRSKTLIPFYNADFMAGKSEAFYDDGSDHPDYYMDVPEFYGCIAFRAFGDSMEPIIKSSSILFGSKMDDDWRYSLEYGQIYGITMLNGRRYLKYIRRAQDHKKMFLLKSANKEYDDFEIYKEKIKNLWLIQGWIDKRA
jgi:phage repressor protein C with HTH and peptisase S24 domain